MQLVKKKKKKEFCCGCLFNAILWKYSNLNKFVHLFQASPGSAKDGLLLPRKKGGHSLRAFIGSDHWSQIDVRGPNAPPPTPTRRTLIAGLWNYHKHTQQSSIPLSPQLRMHISNKLLWMCLDLHIRILRILARRLEYSILRRWRGFGKKKLKWSKFWGKGTTSKAGIIWMFCRLIHVCLWHTDKGGKLVY